jgi:hypothetical protein
VHLIGFIRRIRHEVIYNRQKKLVSAFSVATIPDTQFGKPNINLTKGVNVVSFCLCYVVGFCVATSMPKINHKSCDMYMS